MLSLSRRPAETGPARMAALPSLPVFLDLDGKRALVAGGTDAAAWKAELLAAAGARVDIFDGEPGSEMTRLLERGSSKGALVLHRQPWTADNFAGAALALLDATDDAEARAFLEAGRAASVPVHVIDRPAFCQFQFGSIVDRSPVVVAVSDDGAAPDLTQAVQRRIETMLPRSLAGTKLDGVSETGPASTSRHGQVTLVGAGPGDAELLTLKAVRALQSADVILYDDLVSDEVLDLARREARRIMVGKRGRRDSCRQDDINELMVKLARQGRSVVRLKCGDPMVFGRAGEEIAQLEAAGIPVSVVPGITSASAMASALGISLTHRDHAQSVRFVTGHARSGELPDHLDWAGLADPATTLVVYMGGRTAATFATRLIAHGMPADTPVAAVTEIGRGTQRTLVFTLDDVAGHGITGWDGTSAVLIGIGSVFAPLLAEAARDATPTPALTALAG